MVNITLEILSLSPDSARETTPRLPFAVYSQRVACTTGPVTNMASASTTHGISIRGRGGGGAAGAGGAAAATAAAAGCGGWGTSRRSCTVAGLYSGDYRYGGGFYMVPDP